MDLKGFFENLKEKIVSLYELIRDYCSENKRNAILFASLGASILLLIILILCLVPKGNKKKNTETTNEIVLTQTLLIPDGPEIHRDYNTSRQTKDKWTTEEADEWFTIPTDKDIESLEKANGFSFLSFRAK